MELKEAWGLLSGAGGWVTALIVGILAYLNNKKQTAIIAEKSKAEIRKISSEADSVDTKKGLDVAEQALKLADRYRLDIEASGKKLSDMAKSLESEIMKNKMCEDQLKRTREEVEIERGRNRIFEEEIEKMKEQLSALISQLEKIKNGETS